jgi:hypothetical protein
MNVRRSGSVYVEIVIRAPLDEVWRHTQDPRLHERWDLRFSSIEYLPRASDADPQRFLYATRIGAGLRIAGTGESVATRDGHDGSRTSSLSFGSDSAMSVIREGSGYWKYVPETNGVRFLTSYDYRVRGGIAGRAFDRLVFRPIIGWATAWSFDRLRLWLERGIDPAVSARQMIARSAARIGLAFVFAYHGLVPKLLGPHPDEVGILLDAGVPAESARTMVVVSGVAEIALAIVLLWRWRDRWPVLALSAFLVVAPIWIAVTSPARLAAAFNPLTLNVCMLLLAAVDLVLLRDTPSAANCRRSPAGAGA